MSRVTTVVEKHGKMMLLLNIRAATVGNLISGGQVIMMCPQCGQPSIQEPTCDGTDYIHTAVISHVLKVSGAKSVLTVQEHCFVRHGHVGDHELERD